MPMSPLSAERLRLQQRIPYQRSLGLEILSWGGGKALVRMPCSSRIRARHMPPQVDRLALVGLLDQGLSDALCGGLPADVGISTIELQAQFPAVDKLEGDLILDAEILFLDNSCAGLRANVKAEDGSVVALGSALFRLGQFPTAAALLSDDVAGFDPSPLAGPLDELLGIEDHMDGLALRADNPAIIGWEAGKILHGGAVAALLMAGCEKMSQPEQRLSSLTVQYLRPASGDRRLSCRATVLRSGRAASFLVAECAHDETGLVATASAVFTSRM